MDQAKPAVDNKAELEWIRFYSKKGWPIQWRETILHEFIRDRKLFDELLQYVKGKK